MPGGDYSTSTPIASAHSRQAGRLSRGKGKAALGNQGGHVPFSSPPSTPSLPSLKSLPCLLYGGVRRARTRWSAVAETSLYRTHMPRLVQPQAVCGWSAPCGSDLLQWDIILISRIPLSRACVIRRRGK
jgi:hypothetical protein